MYNLYDKYLRGNSIGCCPLYVGYYLLYVLTGELNRYRPDRQTDRQTHFKSFHCIDGVMDRNPLANNRNALIIICTKNVT